MLLLLLVVVGLLDQVLAIVVAPDLVHAHGELVVPVRHHSLKVKPLLGIERFTDALILVARVF